MSDERFVKLTAPDGSAVWIAPKWVTGLRRALQGESGVTTILLSGRAQGVMENPEQVLNLIQSDT